jgi:hypothetical protein
VEIVFKTEGGLVFMPGLSRPTTIDTTQLPHDQAAELERLVADADFFDLPTSPKTYPKAADVQSYTIRIIDGSRQHEVKLVDPVSDPQLVSLLDCLKGHVRSARSSRTDTGSSQKKGS